MTQSAWLVDGRLRGFAQPFALRIDGNGIVDLVDDRWNEFVGGRRVGALRPVRDRVSFEEAVEAGGAAPLYEQMLDAARGRRSVGVDVTAASPTRRSRIALSVVPVGQGTVELSLRVFQQRETPAVALFDPAAERTDEEVSVCGFCQRVSAFSWQRPELALRQLRIAPVGPQPRLRPAVCGDCERAVHAGCKIPYL